ncbi:transposase [Lysinibacillus boronitolerans]|uniref:transposase n=1 Tax=Lysinibacillus boronitolerans TaxID=309788 RepID=UPI000FFBF139
MAVHHEDHIADKITLTPVFTDIQALDQLQAANQELLDRIHYARQSKAPIVYFDSTHADKNRNQKQLACNAHSQTVDFHPLLTYDSLTCDFLKVPLRPGDVSTSNNSMDFLRPLLTLYRNISGNLYAYIWDQWLFLGTNMHTSFGF